MMSTVMRRFGGRLGDPGAARGATGVTAQVLFVVLGGGALAAVRELLINAWFLGLR